MRNCKKYVLRAVVVVCIAAFASTLAFAQYKVDDDGKSGSHQNPGAAGLTASYVKTGLYVISGGGGNSVLRLTGDGLIVVDGKLPGNYEEFSRKIRKIIDQPVRVLVDTNHYLNHTGTNADFLAQGTQVIAQEHVKQRLSNYHPENRKIAPPKFTYDHQQDLHFGRVEIDLLHFGPARTDGDTVVYFPELKAIALGDLYSTDPMPDYSAGGSLVGWSAALGEVLKRDFTVAIPGSGSPVTRADVEELKARIDAVISRAAELERRGVPSQQLMARLEAEDLPWKPRFSGRDLDQFCVELQNWKAGQ
jgi:cyclase